MEKRVVIIGAGYAGISDLLYVRILEWQTHCLLLYLICPMKKGYG
jgi:hypothetical protein